MLKGFSKEEKTEMRHCIKSFKTRLGGINFGKMVGKGVIQHKVWVTNYIGKHIAGVGF